MRRFLLPVSASALFLASGCAGGSARDTARARLRHPDGAERMAALSAMDREPRSMDRPALLRSAFLDPDPGVRRAAALLVESRTGAPLEQAALEDLALDRPDVGMAEYLLGDHREALRVAAVGSLSRMASPRAWALLADRMAVEPSAGVRVLCARAVSQGIARGAGIFHGRLLDAMRRGLSDESPEVRITCARALAASGDRAGASLLAEALVSADASSRRGLVALLRTATGEDLGEEAGPWVDRYGGPGGKQP